MWCYKMALVCVIVILLEMATMTVAADNQCDLELAGLEAHMQSLRHAVDHFYMDKLSGLEADVKALNVAVDQLTAVVGNLVQFMELKTF